MQESEASKSSEVEPSQSLPPVVSSASSLDTFNEARVIGTLNPEVLGSKCDPSFDKAVTEEVNTTRVAGMLKEGPRLPTPEAPLLQTPSGAVPVPGAPTVGESVPEFLYQLTKMMTDNNRDIIEWTGDRVKVHNPRKLETHVLRRYFRHSKFSSFQRQLNYFGFRKLAGKGKMAPCSYVNESASGDVGCLLLVKRKVPTTSSKDKNKSSRPVKLGASYLGTQPLEPLPKKPVNLSSSRRINPLSSNPAVQVKGLGKGSAREIARTAVGKGVRHAYTASDCQRVEPRRLLGSSSDSNTTLPTAVPPVVNDPLAQLESNYRDSLANVQDDTEALVAGTLTDASLIDLAMIPDPDPLNGPTSADSDAFNFMFVDFPHPELRPETKSTDRDC